MDKNQPLAVGSMLLNNFYRIERVLGQGGFGITYLGTDLSLDRKVAIKEFFPKNYCERDGATTHVTLGTGGSKEFVDRLKAKFLKEAKNIAKFNHEGIIKIFAAFEENGTAYYVMEYIEGESLSEMVRHRGGPLPEAEALKILGQVGEALEFVHEQRINHLDVKPANIMVRHKDNTAVLIDFGLAKQYDTTGQQTSTTPVGISHGYAPNEQYKNGGVSEFSPSTDVYSLAATLYYTLTGIVPPEATTLVEEELTFPQCFPERLIPATVKAMSPARRNRQATVSEFLADIKGAKATPTTKPKPTPAPVNDDTTITGDPANTGETTILSPPAETTITTAPDSTQRPETATDTTQPPEKSQDGLWIAIAAAVILAAIVRIIGIIGF